MKSSFQTIFTALLLLVFMPGVFLFGVQPVNSQPQDQLRDQPQALPRDQAQTQLKEPLPDPFLSYFIKAQKTLGRLEEEKRRQQKLALDREKHRQLTAAKRLEALREPHTDLQKLELAQLTLTAIVSAKGKSWAMVRDKMGRGYILKKGTFIGTKGGLVKEIVWEVTKAFFGKQYVRKVLIKEPYLSKNQYIKYKTIEMKMAEMEYK
jgi:hypothetical protein